MSEIRTGWLIDFNDQIFAPKTVFSQIFQDSDGKNLNDYFNSIEAFHNDKFDNGILKVSKGGTGKSTHTSNSVLIGNGTTAVKNIASASGAFYATSANGEPKFGTLPVAQGGTGLTQFTANRILFGSSDGKSISFIANPTPNSNGNSNKVLGYENNIPQYVDTSLQIISADGTDLGIQLNIGTEVASQVNLLAASNTQSGIVTIGEQTFGGNKKFNNNLTVDGTTYLKNLDMNNGSITNIGGWASNSDEFYFIDNAENTIVFIDNEGVHTTNLSFGNKSNNKGIVMTYTSDDTLTITFEN